MRFLRALWILICAFVISTSPPARAQGEEAPVDEAEQLIAEGVELRKQGNEREALAKFEKAHALRPTPRALAQMGLATKSLRMFVQAEDYLGRALQAEDDGWITENRAALTLALDVVKKNLAWVAVEANVPGELSVDGNRVGQLPLQAPLRVRAGVVRIDIRAEGFVAWSSTETLAGGATATVKATLARAPTVVSKAARPPPSVDRRPIETRDDSRTIWTWSALGVGAAGVVVGTAFGIRTLSLKQQRDDECPTEACNSEKGVQLDEDARRSATWSTIGFAVGAVGLGTAAVLFFTRPSSTNRGISLRVTTRGAALAGAF